MLLKAMFHSAVLVALGVVSGPLSILHPLHRPSHVEQQQRSPDVCFFPNKFLHHLTEFKREIMPHTVMTIFWRCNVAVNYSGKTHFDCPEKKKKNRVWCLLLRTMPTVVLSQMHFSDVKIKHRDVGSVVSLIEFSANHARVCLKK